MDINLHKYQETGVRFLLENRNAGLFWKPGLGKSVTTLCAILAYRQKHPLARVLVVSKKLVINSTWPHEIKKFGFPFTYSIIEGTPGERNYQLNYTRADITLINFELLPWLMNQPSIIQFSQGLLIIDESTKLKNWMGKRFNAVKPHLGMFAKRIILTGTCVPNGIMDIFAQIYIVDLGNRLGKTITDFRNEHFIQNVYAHSWELRSEDEFDKVVNKISDKVLVYDEGLLELPKLNIVDLPIELDAHNRGRYNLLEKEFFLQLSQTVEVTATSTMALGMKLRQFSGGWMYHEDVREYSRVNRFKLNRTVDLIDDLNGEPVLILCEFKHEMRELEKTLVDEFPDLTVHKITSKDTHLVDLWNQNKVNVLIAHPETVAHGINLQAAKKSSILFYSIPWNLENYLQTIARLHRQGREESVFVYRLVIEDTIDEDIASRLEEKGATQESFLSELKAHGLGVEE